MAAQYSRFPGLGNSTDFPDLGTINVYKYRNEFDYSRWKADTKLTLANVAWEAGYDNVVKFSTIDERDSYLDSVSGDSETFDTMRHIKPDGSIKMPWPVSVVQLYNYLIVDLPTPTSDAEPVEGASNERISRYLYFIADAVQDSANTTLCTLVPDIWQTYIYNVDIKYLMLERGHAPMAATSVDTYLSNPVENSEYLTASDVDFGREASIVRHTDTVIYNADSTYAVILTYAALGGSWGGTSAPFTPASSYTTAQGVPSPNAWAIESSDLQSFLTDVDSENPQFKSTVKCVFFIDEDLITLGDSQEFCGHTLRRVSASQKTYTLSTLNKSDFGYSEPYASIAKLYTSPYAVLKVFNSDGSQNLIRIEDTTGTISVRACLNIVYPWVSVDSHMLGIGGANDSLTFYSGTNSRAFTFGGTFGATLQRWAIPTFCVTQSAYDNTLWAHYYDRQQAQLAATNARASAYASAETAQTNANASANTAYNNAANSASNITSNNAVSVAANESLTRTANSAAAEGTSNTNTYQSNCNTADVNLAAAAFEAQQDELAVAASNNDAQAAAGAATAIIGGIGGVLTSGSAEGAIGSVLSAVSSGINTAVSWSTANQANQVALSNSSALSNASVSNGNNKLMWSSQYNIASTDTQNDQRTESTSTQNSAATSIASNNASLTRTNASNTRTTAIANAERSYNTAIANADRAYQTSTSAIQNARDQQETQAPFEYGTRMAGDTVSTRPIGQFAQIVTENEGAITQAGDYFLRYGYALNRQWELTDWQPMEHFTYWKAQDVIYAGSAPVSESASAGIKDILMRGVTVWTDPDEIGKVSIYDNI